MKVFLSALVLLVGLTTVSFAQKGVLKFKEETHKFGKVPQGTPVTNEFVFTNTGTDPVVILKLLFFPEKQALSKQLSMQQQRVLSTSL
jgi:hypothetical protein